MSPRATTPAADTLLTVAQAAAQLGVHTSMVYRWIAAGRLASVQYPSHGRSKGARRIRQSVVTRFLADCEAT